MGPEKPWRQRPGKAMPSCPRWGGRPGPKATPGDNQGRRRLCLQRSCPTLTPRKGQDTKPRSLPMGHLGRRFPGLTASLSHVLPTVGDDHLLLGLPVLAALALCRPNRREKSGQGGWRVSGYAPSTPQSSSSRHGLCLQVPGLLIPLSHRAVCQGPWWSPTCLCTPRSALQSGRLRLWDPQSLGCLVFHSTDSH